MGSDVPSFRQFYPHRFHKSYTQANYGQSRVHSVPSWSSSAKAGSSINMRVSAEAPHGTATGGMFSQTAAEMETGCLNYNSVRYVNRGRP